MTQMKIRAACLGLVMAMVSAVPVWAGSFPVLAGEAPDDNVVRLIYDAADGTFGGAPAPGKQFTALNIQIEEKDASANPPGFQFIGDKPANLSGDFDNYDNVNLFKSTFGESFGAISFGPVLGAGLSKESLLAHLTVKGAYDGGGDVGDVFLQYVPEPSAVVLLGLGMMGLLAARRRR